VPSAKEEEDRLLTQSVSGRRPITREETGRRGVCLAMHVTSLKEKARGEATGRCC